MGSVTEDIATFWLTLAVVCLLLLSAAGLGRRRRRLRPTQLATVQGDIGCGRCGYDVRDLPHSICPECGSDLDEVGRFTTRFRRWQKAPPLLRALVWTVAVAGTMTVCAVVFFLNHATAEQEVTATNPKYWTFAPLPADRVIVLEIVERYRSVPHVIPGPNPPQQQRVEFNASMRLAPLKEADLAMRMMGGQPPTPPQLREDEAASSADLPDVIFTAQNRPESRQEMRDTLEQVFPASLTSEAADELDVLATLAHHFTSIAEGSDPVPTRSTPAEINAFVSGEGPVTYLFESHHPATKWRLNPNGFVVLGGATLVTWLAGLWLVTRRRGFAMIQSGEDAGLKTVAGAAGKPAAIP